MKILNAVVVVVSVGIIGVYAGCGGGGGSSTPTDLPSDTGGGVTVHEKIIASTTPFLSYVSDAAFYAFGVSEEAASLSPLSKAILPTLDATGDLLWSGPCPFGGTAGFAGTYARSGSVENYHVEGVLTFAGCIVEVDGAPVDAVINVFMGIIIEFESMDIGATIFLEGDIPLVSAAGPFVLTQILFFDEFSREPVIEKFIAMIEGVTYLCDALACAEFVDGIVAPTFETVCFNGIDDDGDGATDCAEDECAYVCKVREEICDDGIDNNADGLTDCEDCVACVGTPTCPFHATEDDCDNYCDEDGDTMKDCFDPDCEGNEICPLCWGAPDCEQQCVSLIEECQPGLCANDFDCDGGKVCRPFHWGKPGIELEVNCKCCTEPPIF